MIKIIAQLENVAIIKNMNIEELQNSKNKNLNKLKIRMPSKI